MGGSHFVRGSLQALCVTVLLVVTTGSAALAQSIEDQGRAIARELQCPVCQGLSVADSPSQLAGQMRDVIRTKLAEGESREQILGYFAERYGEWVLLAPPRSGFTAIVWVAPYVGLAAGIAFVVWTVRRRGRPDPVGGSPLHDETEGFLPEVDRGLERLRDEPLR